MPSSKKLKTTLEIIRSNKLFPLILQDILPDGEFVPMKYGTKKMIPALAKTDPEFQKLLIHPDEKVQNLCMARQLIKSWPTHIKRVESMATQARCSDGWLRVPLHHNGAHTGRWSGGEGINLQNLGGKGRAGAGNHPLLGQVRRLLRAPKGYKLLIADSASIEARVLAWFAGQADLIEGFANGEDVYSSFASELFGVEVRKPTDEEHADPDLKNWVSEMEIKRGFGKDGILGCGYGMGPDKFHERCLSNPDLRPMFDSGQYDLEFIKTLIKMYRTKYSMIPEFWKLVESAFKWVTKYPHETRYLYDNDGNPRLTFWNDGGTVNLQLPNGRVLYYRHCTYNKRHRELRWHHGHLWGGSIAENVTQATARDLLAYWLLKCEEVSLPIIFHNHDELISMAQEKDAELELRRMCSIMKTKPDWAAGLPLDVEGEISEFYKK